MQIDWVDSPGRPATRRDLHQELLSARRCEAISGQDRREMPQLVFLIPLKFDRADVAFDAAIVIAIGSTLAELISKGAGE
jgi:hypothetical protein